MRRLGVGSRSEVWLGSDGTETAAIKVFREGFVHDGAARERIDAEIEALGRASGRHLVQLEDLAMGPDGAPCLILQRLSQWNLGRVLGAARPSDGEAVTILAPLCLAAAELHRVGVAHGRIHGGSVLFDATGAPVITSFGEATLFGPMPVESTGFSVPPAQLVQESAVGADLDGLVNLCLSTLRPDSGIVRWLGASEVRDNSTFVQELAERLFQFTAATPVHFTVPVLGEASTSIPSRVSDPAPHRQSNPLGGSEISELAPQGAAGKGTVAADVASLLHLPDGLKRIVHEWLNKTGERGPFLTAVERIKEALRPVRKPVWIIAGLVALSVVLVTAVLPTAGPGNAGQVEELSPSPTPELVAPVFLSAITGDDPLAAASALLDARTACFDARSVLCLDSVNQQGSAAMEADTTQVRLLQQGGAIDGSHFVGPEMGSGTGAEVLVSRHIALQESLGDSVLLTVTFGAPDATGASFSLLLIKREEGWRIRDLTPVTDSPY